MHITRTQTSQIDDISAVKAFIVLQLTGGFGMLFLLCSAFFSRMKAIQRLKVNVSGSSAGPINRSRTWYSFCISWIISCFSYCLLFIANKQFDDAGYGLCVVQAALIYSSPPLTGATTFALFLDVWWMFRASKGDGSAGRAVMTSLLVAPYMFWIILTIGFLVDGLINPQVVEQDLAKAPYCVLNQPFPPTFASSMTLVFGAAVLVMLVILMKATYRVHLQTSQSSSHPSRSFVRPGDDSSSMKQYTQILALISRLIVFGILGLIVVLISVVFVLNRALDAGLDSATAVADLTMAGLPLGGVAIFGTQKDFFQLWSILFQWPLWRFRRGTHDHDSTYKGDSPRLLRQGSIVEMEVLSDVLDIGNVEGNIVPFPRDEEETLTVSPRKVYYS